MASITDLVYIDATGYHFADFPSFLAFYVAGYQAIYGADVYLESDSQDGQFLAFLAQAAYDTAALGGSVSNSFSPVTAQGTGLSRVVKINGLNREIASNSTSDLTIVGVAGTVITNGIAQDTLGQKWDLPISVIIPDSGTIIVTATAETIGAVNAEAGTISTIFMPTRGWQSVTNVAAATPGAPVESDAALRLRQTQSTANPSLTVLEGTEGGVANLPGVTAVRAYENDTGSTDANGLPAHSIAIIVNGGDAMAVAQEIQVHKTPGTQTDGTTSETVYDSHGMPLVIRFYRPTIVTINVTVTIAASAAYSSDFTALIQAAIATQINLFGIGNNVLITKLYAPAYLNGAAAGQTYNVASLEIAKNSDPPGTIDIPIAFNEQSFCDPSVNVTVVVT